MNCSNHPDRERVAFCQNCGKPMCQECTRPVGSAVYCEPCLAAKLASAGAPSAAGGYAYSDPASGVYAAGSPAPGASYAYRDPITGVYVAGNAAPGSPNPVLAAFLGFIPGVGAMYNAQYAKGVVHLVVFAILVSLADNHGIFGLFIAGWEFYMAIEAYHTARARRDGQPLPNPFGLNDLGERLGFGKAWQAGTAATAAPPSTAYTTPYGSAAPEVPTAGATPYAAPLAAGAVPPFWSSPPAQAWEQYAPPVAPYPPAPPVPLDAQVPYPGSRFPAGALWLIGFGVLFLVGNAGFLHGFSSRLFLPVFLIGLAVFIFVKKMTSYGAGLTGDGSPGYRLRVFRALRGSVWIALVGLLFFLDEFNILSWGHSWPLFIILAGVMTVLERGAFSAAATAPPVYGSPYGYTPQPTQAAPAAEPSFIPSEPVERKHDQEGS